MGVKFIRKNGRVIPIRQAAMGATIGATAVAAGRIGQSLNWQRRFATPVTANRALFTAKQVLKMDKRLIGGGAAIGFLAAGAIGLRKKKERQK